MTAVLANHLWQSTAFAAAVWLLTLVLRRNRAQVRFWLWLAASLKFLVPFSLLVDLGTSLTWTPAAQAVAAQVVTPPVSYLAEKATQPFIAMPTLTPVAHPGHGSAAALVAVWACGFLAVAAMRVRGWLRVRAAVRASVALELRAPFEVRAAPGRLEPGVVGVLRPVLLVPEGIIERLAAPQLAAVLEHERCHIRRRDNLWSALHMVVEALFWFYPPVWWIGARMLAERERACDEGVLAAGGEPRDYAGAIVSVCKFYVESPLPCVAGVTGANVRRRIEAIMLNRGGLGLGCGKRWLLTGAAIAALAGPAVVGLAIGLGHAPVLLAQAKAANPKILPHFTVASVKPIAPGSRTNPKWQRDSTYWRAPRARVNEIIGYAYGVSPYNNVIVGLPDWTRKTEYDFQVHMPPGTSEARFRLMLQSLLAERFQLKVHTEMRPQDVAVMTVAGPTGPDLHPARRTCVPPAEAPAGGALAIAGMSSAGIETAGCSVSMDEVAAFFTYAAIHPVVNETGLKGLYDLDVTIKQPPGFKGETRNEAERRGALATKAAFQKQLGLNLDFTKLVKRPMPVLVIDHIAPATAN